MPPWMDASSSVLNSVSLDRSVSFSVMVVSLVRVSGEVPLRRGGRSGGEARCAIECTMSSERTSSQRPPAEPWPTWAPCTSERHGPEWATLSGS